MVNRRLVKHVVVRERAPLNIVLVDDADAPLPNLKCKVVYQDGQAVEGESDANGVLKVPRKADGKIEIQLLEEKGSAS